MTPYPEKSKAPEPVEKVAPESGDTGALGRSIDAETSHSADPEPTPGTTAPDGSPLVSDEPQRDVPATEPTPAPDDDGHALVVFRPVASPEPHDDFGEPGQILGVCRTREAAEKLSGENEGTEIHTYAYVEDSPLFS